MNRVSRFLNLKRFCPMCALLVLAAIGLPMARAQSAPPPIGTWNAAGNVNTLVVEQNGTCGFLVNGRAKWSGKCTWQPSARGGILTLTYPMPLTPGHIRWSVVYTNQTNITVDGEAFHKTAN